MEFILEMLMELILEGSIELSKNKKVPKWLRYPLILMIVLFFGVVIGLIFIVGVFFLETSVVGGILLILIALVLFVASIIKFKKIYITKKTEIEDKTN